MALTLAGVAYRYPGAEQRAALQALDLDCAGTGCVAIVGPSGSGKSTLGKLMNGLLRPTTGTVLLDGTDLQQLASLAEARRRVGLLMQQPDNQLFGTTVGEDIRFGPQQAGFDDQTCIARMGEAMERVGLAQDAFVARSPFSLSGGERRRVALAGLLAMQPQHLVLDEPVAGLDPAGRESIEAVIGQTAAEIGVVLLTSDLPLALRLADHLVLLEEGQIVFQGSPAGGVADRALLERLRLRVPVQVDLLDALRAHGFGGPQPADLRPTSVIRLVQEVVRERGVS